MTPFNGLLFGNLLIHKKEFYRLLAAPQHKASFLRSVLHNSCMCKVTEHLFGMERQHNVLILDKSEHPFSNMKIISCVRFELDFRGQIFTRRRSIAVAM